MKKITSASLKLLRNSFAIRKLIMPTTKQKSTLTEVEEEVKSVWQSCDCVCLDVDSTLCMDEGIDELGEFLGKGQEVADLTRRAMQGSMTYKESLTRRLDILSPSQEQVSEFISSHPPRLTPRVKELVNILHQRKVPVYLISGGFTCIIHPAAKKLGIPTKNVFANRLLFDYNGDYHSFDASIPLCDGGGKPVVIRNLKEKYGYKQLVHIGDGVTDLEACPPANAFIGFGGNQIRDKVQAESKWFVTDFQELIDHL